MNCMTHERTFSHTPHAGLPPGIVNFLRSLSFSSVKLLCMSAEARMRKAKEALHSVFILHGICAFSATEHSLSRKQELFYRYFLLINFNHSF